MLTKIKEWLFLTFFPQEDINELNRLRRNLTPFLKAVINALSVELELNYVKDLMRKSIINQIIQNLPAENSASTTINFFSQTVDTLHDEFDGLLNIK